MTQYSCNPVGEHGTRRLLIVVLIHKSRIDGESSKPVWCGDDHGVPVLMLLLFSSHFEADKTHRSMDRVASVAQKKRQINKKVCRHPQLLLLLSLSMAHRREGELSLELDYI